MAAAVNLRLSLLFLIYIISTTITSGLTITTFNMLAPVHRSILGSSSRESERIEWWGPRAYETARFIAGSNNSNNNDMMRSSDAILLQEWWFGTEFEKLFDEITGPQFERVAERRPNREDGMAVLVRRDGALALEESCAVATGPQRIAQLVRCRERHAGRRPVVIANTHLSFPSHADPQVNQLRQADEAGKILEGLTQLSSSSSSSGQPCLEIMGGDFNSDANGLAARLLESRDNNFVNCMSASAEQAFSDKGGRVGLGVTHRTHRGEHVSVDHIFARLTHPQKTTTTSSSSHKSSGRLALCGSALKLGYLDASGTRVVECRKGDLNLHGAKILSDHRPVTVTLEWPRHDFVDPYLLYGFFGGDDDSVHLPLDPLEPPSYLGNLTTAGLGV